MVFLRPIAALLAIASVACSLPIVRDSAHITPIGSDDTLPAHSSAFLGSSQSTVSSQDSAQLSLLQRASTDPDVISQLGHASNRRVSRSVGSSGTFTTSVDRLKAVARVANGIYLTRELIKGTDKQEEITSELLKMGSVTPAQIIGLKSYEVQTALVKLMNLPKDLNVQDEMRAILQNAESTVIIKKNFVNITDITEWPEKSTFMHTLGEVGWKTVLDDTIRKVFYTPWSFFLNYNNATDHDVGSTQLVNVTDELIFYLPKLNAAFSFSDTGSASHDFSRIRGIVRSLENYRKIVPTNFADSGVMSTLDTFFGMANQLDKVADDVKKVMEVIKTRSLPGSLRQLDHTAGFIQGQEDLSNIDNDLKDQWMKDLINSSSFEKAMQPLRHLNIPLKKSHDKLGTFDEKTIATFEKLVAESEKFDLISSERSTITAAIEGVNNCTGGPFENFDVALNLTSTVEEVDAKYVVYRSKIQEAIQIVQNESLIERLKVFRAQLVKSENQGKSLKQIFPNDTKKQQYDPIFELCRDQLTNLIYFDFGISPRVKYLWRALNNLTTPLENVSPNASYLQCVADTKNVNFVEEFNELFKSAIDHPRIDYQTPFSIVSSVASSSKTFGDVFTAIAEIKGTSSEESKGLELLEDPKRVSDDIGNAVRGIGEIQKAIEAIPAMEVVVENQMNLAVERLAVEENLTTTEIAHLKRLETFDFTTLAIELDTFKDTVDSSPLVSLQDSSVIFEAAKKLNRDIKDLGEVLKVLDKLMTLPTDSMRLVSLRLALAELRNIDLDFSKFHQYYEPAKTSMKDLETFFIKYSSSVGDQKLDDGVEISNVRKPEEEEALEVPFGRREELPIYSPELSAEAEPNDSSSTRWITTRFSIVYIIFTMIFTVCFF